MRAARKRRRNAVILILAGSALGITLVLLALQQNLNHFFTPSQIVAGEPPTGREIRAGGLVVAGSLQRDPGSLYVEFDITDTAASVRVNYDGILPDLFREVQGIIAPGTLTGEGVFTARSILAKHDENYMPPEVMKAIEAAGHPGDAG